MAGAVGPNGAGRSTIIRALLGLIRPTADTAHVLGEPIRHPERYLSRTGAMIVGRDVSRLEATLELVGLATARGQPNRTAGRTGEVSW